MQFIVFTATLVSLYFLHKRGLRWTFIHVWTVIFLGAPTVFWVNIPGLPDPNFMQAAILPLLFVLLRDHLARVQLGKMELLILLYFAVRVVNDYQGRGYSDAQNYLFYLLSSLLGPYFLARLLITSHEWDMKLARQIVLIFVCFFPLFLYESKFWVSPIFKILAPFFPGANSGLSIRWGLARTAGTFEHPILACVMVIIAYRLHRWLCWCQGWEGQKVWVIHWVSKVARYVRMNFTTLMAAILVLMALMTISRGPWIGGIAAAIVVACGNTKKPLRNLQLAVLVLGVGAVVGKTLLDIYTTPADGAELSGEAQTMLYRKVMLEKYEAFLMERYWQGWGLTTVPKIKGMESVDNAFFLMALQHGVIAPAIFLLIFMYAIYGQIRHAIRNVGSTAPLGFTFSGIYLMCLIAFFTVYMGAQTEPMLFLLLGWGENIKNRKPQALAPDPRLATPQQQGRSRPYSTWH